MDVRKAATVALVAAAIVIAIGLYRKYLVLPKHPAPSAVWRTLRDADFQYAVPEGWTAADPFNSKTPYASRLWYRELPPVTARTALLATSGLASQLLLVLGAKDQLWRSLEANFLNRYDDDPALEKRQTGTESTVDGIPVEWCSVRVRPKASGSDAMDYFLGVADLGDRALVFNGGGIVPGFDLAGVLAIVKSVRVSR